MVTTIKLHGGVLTTRREGSSETRWPTSIAPAIAFLRSRGGGSFFVFSR